MTRLQMYPLACLAAALCVAAHADTFQFSYSGAGFTANGTFTGAVTNTPGIYQITDVSGTRNGLAISGLDPGADYADDLLYYPPQNTMTAQPTSYLDNNGIAYLVGNTSYNIYSSDATPALVENYDSVPITNFTLTPVAATPEPSTLVLLGSGLLMSVGALRRKVFA